MQEVSDYGLIDFSRKRNGMLISNKLTGRFANSLHQMGGDRTMALLCGATRPHVQCRLRADEQLTRAMKQLATPHR